MNTTRRITLNATPTPREPPGEFRIFRAGRNGTTKGELLFDDEAARSVQRTLAAQSSPARTSGANQPAAAPEAAGSGVRNATIPCW